MRIQDKIKGHRIAKRKATEGSARLLCQGIKLEDELPIPHHSGYVEAPADVPPKFHHQKTE
jgi:NADH-quinone oxidoreductase subunit B